MLLSGPTSVEGREGQGRLTLRASSRAGGGSMAAMWRMKRSAWRRGALSAPPKMVSTCRRNLRCSFTKGAKRMTEARSRRSVNVSMALSVIWPACTAHTGVRHPPCGYWLYQAGGCDSAKEVLTVSRVLWAWVEILLRAAVAATFRAHLDNALKGARDLKRTQHAVKSTHGVCITRRGSKYSVRPW